MKSRERRGWKPSPSAAELGSFMNWFSAWVPNPNPNPNPNPTDTRNVK